MRVNQTMVFVVRERVKCSLSESNYSIYDK